MKNTIALSLTALVGALALSACADQNSVLAPDLDPAFKSATVAPVWYSGQGTYVEDGVRMLGTEICGIENGAEVDGPYLLWILTANGASSASITIHGETFAMTKAGGGNSVYKYVGAYHDLDSLIGNVSGSWVGTARGSVQLVISHGCPPDNNGAWCSPGYWRNARDAAWALTGYARTDLFNDTAVDQWFPSTFVANPTLQTVLENAPAYNAIGARHAVAAMLTDAIPGFSYDADLVDSDEDVCPLDNHGNFKD